MSGIGLLAAFAVAGVTAGAASAAEPVLVSKAAIGQVAGPVAFTGTMPDPLLYLGAESKLTCHTGSISGEMTGPKALADVVMILTHCESGGGEFETHGYPFEIVTNPMAGVLGALSPTEPGIKLFSEAGGRSGIVMEAEAFGGAVTLKVRGEITAALSGHFAETAETATFPSTLKLVFAVSKGIQKYRGFSEGLEAGLVGQWEQSINGGAWEGFGVGQSVTLKSTPVAGDLAVTE